MAVDGTLVGKQVAQFYKILITECVDQETAVFLTNNFLAALVYQEYNPAPIPVPFALFGQAGGSYDITPNS